jgi:hypothetical protein
MPEPVGVEYFVQSDNLDPPLDSAVPTSASSIEALLSSDLAPDGQLDTPLELGIKYTTDQPTDEIAPGVVAQIHVESAVVDLLEPSSIRALASGIALLGALAVARRGSRASSRTCEAPD